MTEQDIIKTVRSLFSKVRTDKKEGYFKANKEICAFLGREKSRVTRYVSTTSSAKITQVTPESFLDPTDKPKERLTAKEKLTRGFRLYMFIVWAAKATGMPDAEDFIKELEKWAGMKHEEALKIWLNNGRKPTMNRDTIKQWADVRWSHCRKPGHRQSQLGTIPDDLFEFAKTNKNPGNVSELTAPYKRKSEDKKKVEKEAPLISTTVIQGLLDRMSAMEKKIARMQRDIDNPQPRFKRRETLCPIGFFPKSHIAEAIRSVINLSCGARKGITLGAATKLTEYYVNYCEYHERYQMTAAETDMSMLPFAKSSGLIRDDSLKRIPDKVSHQPLKHWGESYLMCIVSGENHFTDGGTSTAFTRYYSVDGLARALNFLWSYAMYAEQDKKLAVNRALTLWEGGVIRMGIDAWRYLDTLTESRSLMRLQDMVSDTCHKVAESKKVEEVDPFGFGTHSYKWVNRSEADDAE